MVHFYEASKRIYYDIFEFEPKKKGAEQAAQKAKNNFAVQDLL